MRSALDTDSHDTSAATGLIRAGLLTALAAAALAAVVALVLGAVGVDLQVPVEPGGDQLQQLPLAPVLIAAGLPVLVGTIVYALVRRASDRPAWIWRIVVVAVTLLSFAPVLSVGGGIGNQVGLGLLHVVVGSTAALLLPRFAGDS